MKNCFNYYNIFDLLDYCDEVGKISSYAKWKEKLSIKINNNLLEQ